MGGVWFRDGGGGVRVDVNEIEVFVKIQKEIFFLGGGESVGGSGSGWGVRVDVNEELKFFVKIQKKKIGGGGSGGGGGGGGGGGSVGGGRGRGRVGGSEGM